MRGLDTNVLVRYVTDDVVCELCWTLRGKRYRYDRPTIASVLEKMLDAWVFEFEHRALVARAAKEYRLGRADFADSLIGLSNERAGCEDTVSFDGRLEALGEFTVL